MTATWALVRNQFRILRRDPSFLIVLLGMPLVVTPVLKNTIGLSLAAEGYAGANGAEHVVPGQAVTFAFMVAGSMTFAVFQEHGWRTWDRLRVSSASPLALTAGFSIPWILITALFQAILFLSGVLFLDLDLGGTLPAVAVLVVTYSVCLVGFAVMCTAVFNTVKQIQGVINLGAMAFAALGGALVPRAQLPSWARAVSPLTPDYWAMRGYRSVLLDRSGFGSVLLPSGLLLAAGVGFAVIGAARFRVDEPKEFFA